MLKTLDHVTLRSTDLARTLRFYQQLLGMEPGPRPAFDIPGSWLCVAGHPALQVLEMPLEGRGSAIDHVAFEACGRAGLSARLDAAAVPFELVALPDGSALQMFLRDPDGALIELVFRQPEDR
jgi:catechol 2,3-dioxygenase-like lactoylglutathione lyase family enzyme